MIERIRSIFTTHAKLNKLQAEHARSIAHREALLKLAGDRKTALTLALQQIDLQIAAVEYDIRQLGEAPPVTTAVVRNDRLR